jgi:threonine/homoserine/homoserine lactone efflux protein
MSFIAFLIAAAVLAITPGPGIARVVARQLAVRRVSGVTLVFFWGHAGHGAKRRLSRRETLS